MRRRAALMQESGRSMQGTATTWRRDASEARRRLGR
jgi:hypothetical protein